MDDDKTHDALCERYAKLLDPSIPRNVDDPRVIIALAHAHNSVDQSFFVREQRALRQNKEG